MRTCVIHTLYHRDHAARETFGALRTGSPRSTGDNTASKARTRGIFAARINDFFHSPFVGAACLVAFAIIAILKPFSLRPSTRSPRTQSSI